MDSSYHINFNDSIDVETFYDFHGIQVFKNNTTVSNRFIDEGRKFDEEILKRLDEKNRCKVIFIADQIPPLSSLLKYIEGPFQGAEFGAYAIIMPKDPAMLVKFTTTFLFSLPISKNAGKYAVKVFDNSNREDLSKVAKWMDDVFEKRDKNEDVVGVDIQEEKEVHNTN